MVTTLATVLWIPACRPRHRGSANHSSADELLAAPDSTSVPPRLWVFYGGQAHAFCLLLRDDGSGVFYGGFLTHNPVHWSYDSSHHLLDLVLPHLSPDDYYVLRHNFANGYFVALDTTSGTVSYSLDRDAPAINLFNWVLVPAEHLKKWQISSAREGCPVLRAPPESGSP